MTGPALLHSPVSAMIPLRQNGALLESLTVPAKEGSAKDANRRHELSHPPCTAEPSMHDQGQSPLQSPTAFRATQSLPRDAGLSQATFPMYPARLAEQSSLNPFKSHLDAQQASGEAATMTAPRSPYAGELNTSIWIASVCIVKRIRGFVA